MGQIFISILHEKICGIHIIKIFGKSIEYYIQIIRFLR